MLIHAVNLLAANPQPPIRTRTRRVQIGVAPPGGGDPELETIVRLRTPRSGLELTYNRSNVMVVNHGLAQAVTIEGQPLAYGAQYAWLEHQDLQIGEQHLLRWEADPPLNLSGCGWQLAWLALLLILLLPFGFASANLAAPGVANFANGVRPDVVRIAATLFPNRTLSVSRAGTNLAARPVTGLGTDLVTALAAGPRPGPAPDPVTGQVTGQVTETPSRASPPPLPSVQPFVATPRPTITAMAADSVAVTERERQDVITATAAAATAATAAAAGPAPCREAPINDVNWDPEIAMWVQKACVRPGEQYWRLLEARWLDDEKFDGYHHLFVDVRDEEFNRISGANFVMSWPDGNCRRSIGQGMAEPLDHGNHCTMTSPGGAYQVWVDGLPSEVVHGLGLGAVDSITRPADFMTSFYLVFQRAEY
jgi:hypothetical protein